ncbi:uracil phosphoribosyltransferase [Coraliomargarita sinensis]|uniref:Uracil phosphoribosyltransferase n=1 Tax=Coraliomargarita sinensis TaxID=2174842 RepID=A0A317ZFB0_9BACT|nr:uracil phosphoribosyltransferase [Coraliomargarita sinensis]PXA03047.1 uracil phosphoribosyltransferase [Coraliomargarita sinensis]
MTTELSHHPLVQHYLTTIRDVATEAPAFRRACSGMTQVLVAEAAKLLEVDSVRVQTPLEETEGARIAGSVVFVPILRAGLGMLDHAMATIPGSSVGYIGLERDEATAVASCYYAKMPVLDEASQVYVLDPMLATGGSAVQCVDQLKQRGAKKLCMICIIAAPEGIACLEAAHPDVKILAGKVDRQLNEQKYILPGLGDFGDRLFNT